MQSRIRVTRIVEDMHTLRTTVQAENPGVPYFMMGHSMGSYMLRKYLCLHGENLSGAVIMGTGCVPDGTMKFGMTLCKFLAFFRGWNYRSKLCRNFPTASHTTNLTFMEKIIPTAG